MKARNIGFSSRKVMNDNKKLITQMLPPIYQQNDASILRTNYPGHFNSADISRKPEVASESKSNMELLVR